MRVRLIATEVLAAAALASAVLLVSPDDMSKAYALVMIATGVLPGLMLTGEVKLINAGIAQLTQALLSKTVTSAVLNVPIGVLTLVLQDPRQPPALFVAFVLLGTLGATAQAFSSTWYYVQADKFRVIHSKLLSAIVKMICAGAAAWLSELTWALIGMTLGAILEFTLNFRCLPWRCSSRSDRLSPLALFSPLGIAYGLSRVVSAGIRVGLSSLFGSLIASFLVIEQLVGGVNSLFEKYFVRSIRWRRLVRTLKVAYLLGMFAFVPWVASQSFSPSDRVSLLWLTVVACAGLLPLAEMYVALELRGQNFVAIGAGMISLSCAAVLGMAWFGDIMSQTALVAYVALPSITFLFYWFSASNARNDSQL